MNLRDERMQVFVDFQQGRVCRCRFDSPQTMAAANAGMEAWNSTVMRRPDCCRIEALPRRVDSTCCNCGGGERQTLNQLLILAHGACIFCPDGDMHEAA